MPYLGIAKPTIMQIIKEYEEEAVLNTKEEISLESKDFNG